MATYDLLIRGGTLLDPAQGIHDRRDVAFAGGRVAAVAEAIPTEAAARVVEADGKLVTPGLVDIHVHVFDGVSHYGIPPDSTCMVTGATTVVDAGSAGADTFRGFRKYVIDVSRTRILAQLNISSMGMIAHEVGELDSLRWANVPKALKMIEANRDVILGVKVRLTRDLIVGAEAGIAPLHLAREAADAAGLPIMVHPQGAWCPSIDDILAVMRKGDIVTHCYHGPTAYHGTEHGVLDERGQVRDSVRAAIERGVIFDVGHGRGSFDWEIVERALEQGLLPTTISSDLHAHNVDGPVFDLATTVAKFLYLGLSLEEALAKVTSVPAEVVKMPGQVGTLAAGAHGDAVVFDLETGEFPLQDARLVERTGRQRLVPRTVVKAGQVVARDGREVERPG